jgi:uncharacterized protein DUF6702
VKVNNKYYKQLKIVPTAKNIFCCLLAWMLLSSFHPYYVSVTEIKYNEQEKTLQISCRTFTDNIEDALRKLYKKQVDVLHPKDKKEIESILADYLSKHVKIKVNGKLQTADFIGYEKEEEAIWCYLEIKNLTETKLLVIENTLLYDYLPQQINMVHVEMKGKNQSQKVTNPEKEMVFDF